MPIFVDFYTLRINRMGEDTNGYGRAKQLEPEDFYYTEDGYLVFTEAYHLKRGYCCRSGCKHCPYGFDKRTGMIRKKA